MSTISLQEVQDREAIRDCLHRYCRGIDRVDEELLRGVYWPDGVDEHGSFSGNAYDFIDWVMPILEKNVQTSHTISNILFDFDGEFAATESYFEAYERFRNRAGVHKDLRVGGRYLDRFERRGGEWRILSRVVVIDWFRSPREAADLDKGIRGKGPEKTMGGHAPEDESYSFFERRLDESER